MGLPAAPRGEVLPLAAHALALTKTMRDGQVHLRPHKLTWHGRVQPSVATNSYDLHLEMSPRNTPKVSVTAPALKPNEHGLLPHVYDDGTLCVSRVGEWRPDLLVTVTILPWASEWLFFYELWLATGVWYGDGPDCLDVVSQARILHPYG